MIKMLKELKNILKEKSVNFKEITDEIISVDNFLTDDELSFIWDKINSASQADWEIEYMSNLKNFCLEKFGRSDVENLVAEGKFEITQNWVDKNLNIGYSDVYRSIHERLDSLVKQADPSLELSGFATIQRMQPEVELKAHTDSHTDPSIHYAAILYINDDYSNGELFFPNLDRGGLRPKPKTLLIFPGDDKHNHGVEPVGDGPIRYVIVGFIKEIGYYERNKY
jgi:hypothetical protein